MPSFLEAVEGAATAAFCNVLGDFRAFENNVNRALGFQDPAPGPAGAAYSWVCDRPRPQPTPPFLGGQCSVPYNVTIRRTATTRRLNDPATDSTTTTEFTRLVAGPIRGLQNRAAPPYQSANLWILFGVNQEGFLDTGFVGGGVQIIRDAFAIVRLERADGQPDNCGNPPPDTSPPPPGYNNYTTNITYNDNNGNNFTFPIVVAVGYANVGISGELNIPMTFNFTLNPEFNFEINFNLNTGKPELVKPRPNLPGPGKPPDPLDPIPGPDPTRPPFPDPENPDAPPEEEEPKTKRLLRGVIVTTTEPPGSISKVFQQSNPDLMLPDLGQVQFQIQVGNVVSWTGHTKVQSRRHFIPCPWEYGAIGVSGTPRPGITWQLTPVYIEQTYAPKYPPDSVLP